MVDRNRSLSPSPILVGRLPPEQREMARKLGIGFAMLTRLALLFSLSWVVGLTAPLFTVFDIEISGRDLVLIIGGLFLLAKSTHEIHTSMVDQVEEAPSAAKGTLYSIIIQIGILDIVFSLDSVITAVGLVDHLSIMVIAVVGAVIVMLLAAKSIGDFVDEHPSIKMLALSFLMLIGFTLMSEGFDVHVPKGYIYFAIAFSVAVEMLNIRMRSNMEKSALRLHKKIEE